ERRARRRRARARLSGRTTGAVVTSEARAARGAGRKGRESGACARDRATDASGTRAGRRAQCTSAGARSACTHRRDLEEMGGRRQLDANRMATNLTCAVVVHVTLFGASGGTNAITAEQTEHTAVHGRGTGLGACLIGRIEAEAAGAQGTFDGAH